MGAPTCPWSPPDIPLSPQVMPKVEVLRRDTLKQCKEEVSIQVRGGPSLRWGLGWPWGWQEATEAAEEGWQEQGPQPPLAPRPGGHSPSLLCVPRDRSGTRLFTGWGTAGRASATSSSVSDHLPAGSPQPPRPRTCPRCLHTCPRTRARSPRAARCPAGIQALGCWRPPCTHHGDRDEDTAMGKSRSRAGTSVGVKEASQPLHCPGGPGGCATSMLT